MYKIGFLFAGQGQQFYKMGQDLVSKYESAARVYDNATKILGFDVLNLSEEDLNQTEYAQIAIYVLNQAMVAILDENNIVANTVAGLSLGEYNALTYAGSLSFEEGLGIIAKRGKIMANSFPSGKTKMMICLRTDRETVEKSLLDSNVAICNVNTPSQIVIGGKSDDIDNAISSLKQNGVRMILPLKMSVVSHMYLLKDASDELRKELSKIQFTEPQINFINNIDAELQTEDFVDTLSRHISETVEFSNSINKMLDLGVDYVIEIGPKKSLVKFVDEISNGEIKTVTVCDVKTMKAILNGS